MKYVVVLYDGMADYPVEALGGKTPMQKANKPIFDSLAKRGEVGLVRTIGEGLKQSHRYGLRPEKIFYRAFSFRGNKHRR